MLHYLDKLVYYADPTLPAFSSLAALYLVILGSALLISIRSRQHIEAESAQ